MLMADWCTKQTWSQGHHMQGQGLDLQGQGLNSRGQLGGLPKRI